MHSEGVEWQLSSYASDHAEWKLADYSGLATSSLIGLNNSTTKAGWYENTAFFFIGINDNVQIYEYDGSANLEWTEDPVREVEIGDTFKIVIN